MDSRQRMLIAMSNGEPDRVPRDISWGMSPGFYERFKEKTGKTDYMEHFKVDYRFVSFKKTIKQNDYSQYFAGRISDESFYFNEWGIGAQKGSEKGSHFERIISPLKNADSVSEIVDYPLPDLVESYRSDHFIDEVNAVHQRGLAAAGPLAQTLFETAWMIRGFEEFMIDMIENEDFAECLLDRMMELRIKAAAKYAKADVDVLMLGDDVAMQTGMLIDPYIWRKWLKPRMAKIIASAKSIKPDLNIFYHSDGNPEAVIDDLIEIGVNILNPIQPECMDPALIKRKYGSKLAFWGAIGVQTNLPFGTAEDVANEVKLRMETIGRNGGFIIGPSHMIEPEVPWENLVTLYDAVDRFGGY